MKSRSGGGGRNASFGFIVMLAFVLLAYGCTGPTSVSPQGGSAGYSVDVKMDPVTLNPPQLGSLTFRVTDNKTQKAVNTFEAVSGALLHNIIISKSLEFFRHDTARNLVGDQVSVPAYFPQQGTFYTYTLYKPAGAALQTFRTTIVSGSDSPPADLAAAWATQEGSRASRSNPQPAVVKVTNGLSVAWVKGRESIAAGQPVQLLFRVTERGQPVTTLWYDYEAPGHLWLVDQEGNNFTHLTAASESRQLLPNPTPAEGTSQGTGSSSDPIPVEIPAGGGTQTPVPTLEPRLQSALATVTSLPFPTLLPVQQTPAAGITGAQVVRPAIGFGPDLVFTQTFPRDGFYKMWLEVKWQNEVVKSDFVVKVGK